MIKKKEFETAIPEEVGISSSDILGYIDALEHSETEMHGLMIMRHNKLITKGWWAPFGPNIRHGLQSHTKTYAATAVGIAYTEGLVKLDERLIDIFPDESPEEPSENLKLLTVRDVLCMGCGMDTMPFPSMDWIKEFMHTPVNHKPGTTYMYNSTGSTLLGAIVRKKTGLGLHDYLTPRLFNKIGIDPDNLRWACMPDGMEVGGGGLYATTEDNFRLMKLYADGGVWEGERILAEDYVKLATTNQNDSATESINNPEAFDNFLGYGFQIWMCKPEHAYRADGAMGQFTIVLPDQDMIISITETAIGAHWAQSTLDITWDFIAKVTGDSV
ncbi:MAG: serine hydrolase, partial [Erysipelotrichaceae bacterium]|nr:serine hydrolase [Erysipelotrichaceae bacterium]